MFDELYGQLNKAQKEAVDTVEGPVMVVAGPGTGKTQILTLRIANILKRTQIGPGNILALTFTEASVASMRRRLADIIGTPAYSVAISTFHGFCNDVIGENPGEFPRVIGSTNITEVDQVNLIEESIQKLPLKELRPFGDPLFYVRAILACINDLKREGINPEQFKNIVTEELKSFDTIEDLYHEKGVHKGKMKGEHQKLQKQLAKNSELAEVYAWYQTELAKRKLYDYSDMIMETLRELSSNQNLLLQLQEQYQYLLVDEHQDTNNAQNRILELLANFHDNPNIFVVGDEKQAIFRFQGASLENFLYFKKLYPSAKLIVLEDNYRSTQPILDAAHSLLAGEKPLKSAYRKDLINPSCIGLYPFSSAEMESRFLTADIKKRIDSGIQAQEIAVLYRENRDAFYIAASFEKSGILFIIESDQDILSDPDIKKVLMLFETVRHFGSDEPLLKALHIDFLGFEPLAIYKLIDGARQSHTSAYDLIKLKNSPFNDFYKKLAGWATLSHNISLPELFEMIVRESEFLKHIMASPAASEKLNKLNGLFDELKAMLESHRDHGLSEFINHLQTLWTHNLLLKKSANSTPGMVRLMTAHRAKGQEFEYVYITNAFDGHWGSKRRPNHLTLPSRVFSLTGQTLERGTTDDDERRLFYVALTRAKKSVSISYSTTSLTDQDQLPSRFVTEIKPELIKTMATEVLEKEFAKQPDLIYAPRVQKGADIRSKGFIADLFRRNGLSVTGLNNYLKCPWQYFYTNLLRIPQAKTKHQMYGTAVHYALKDFFDSKRDQRFLLDKFNFYLNRELASESERIEMLEKGNKALTGWFGTYDGRWPSKVISEFQIKGLELTPNIRLTGVIDKLELLNNNGEINVVDYKTSKPKTKGDIDGTTKTSYGDIRRQVVFYNLLLNLYDKGKYKMVSADIDFIEPDEKGRYKKEPIMVQPEEVKDLEELIKKTADEILNAKFWDRTCEDKECSFCALRQVIRS